MSNKTGLLAFLYFDFLPSEGVRAGLLTINRYGYPADFCYSSPIIPSALQKALYGELLESYLLQALYLELSTELSEQVSCIFTNHYFPLTETNTLKKPLYHVAVKDNQETEFKPLYQFNTGQSPDMLIKEYPFEVQEPFYRIERALMLLKDEKN